MFQASNQISIITTKKKEKKKEKRKKPETLQLFGIINRKTNPIRVLIKKRKRKGNYTLPPKLYPLHLSS